jgi:two-component SAPR family response regulator
MGLLSEPAVGRQGMMIGDAAGAKGINTLIITGYAFQLPREELLRYDYLLKPVPPSELLRAIERTLDGLDGRSH